MAHKRKLNLQCHADLLPDTKIHKAQPDSRVFWHMTLPFLPFLVAAIQVDVQRLAASSPTLDFSGWYRPEVSLRPDCAWTFCFFKGSLQGRGWLHIRVNFTSAALGFTGTVHSFSFPVISCHLVSCLFLSFQCHSFPSGKGLLRVCYRI